MKLIVGLGNPGPEYQFTPHNAGFLALDRLAERAGIALANRRGKALTGRGQVAGHDALLAKPETFMNLSGQSVAALLREFSLDNPAEDLIVVYDELAFPLGRLGLKERGSANGHNGMRSILSSLAKPGVLGTDLFARVRIGVGKETPEGRPVRAGGADYLLTPMRRMQLQELDPVLDRAAEAVERIVRSGIAAAMNEFNRRDAGEPGSPA